MEALGTMTDSLTEQVEFEYAAHIFDFVIPVTELHVKQDSQELGTTDTNNTGDHGEDSVRTDGSTDL